MDDVIDDIISMSNYEDQPYIDPIQMPNTVSKAKKLSLTISLFCLWCFAAS